MNGFFEEETDLGRLGSDLSGLSYAFSRRWYPCAAMDAARFVWWQKAGGANFRSQPCIQIALVRPDNPSTITALGSLQSAGENVLAATLSGVTGGAFWARFGLAYASATGGTFDSADCSFRVSWTQAGLLLDGRQVEVFASVTQSGFREITQWIPAIWADKVRAALIATSMGTNVKFKICYRTATTATASPGAWTTITTTPTSFGAGEANSGEATLSLGTVGWVQFGIEYYMESGGTPGNGTIQAQFAVRK